MNDILYEVLKAVLVLAVILITRYAVPYVKSLLENSKYSWIVTWVGIAVHSAEQTIFGEKSGEEKKAAVMVFLRDLLSSKNINITDEQLSNLIEAAVFEMNGGVKE